mmetsp:Transcript_3095/g.2075  ORF Transcript_3095/g.2075 Transcript_3095/m.2075 type:complete len:128 (+) Transcript_3095:157-540(+)
MYHSMPTIEERESESDVKEELERKEKEYQRNIERLEETLEDLKRQYEELQHEYKQLNQNVIEYSPEEILAFKQEEISNLELQLHQIEEENKEYEQQLEMIEFIKREYKIQDTSQLRPQDIQKMLLQQ